MRICVHRFVLEGPAREGIRLFEGLWLFLTRKVLETLRLPGKPYGLSIIYMLNNVSAYALASRNYL